MPSGPPSLHQYWCDQDTYVYRNGKKRGAGDMAAWAHLKSRGYTDHRFIIRPPSLEHKASKRDNSAIDYLCWEWDYCYEKEPLGVEQSTDQNRPAT